MPNEVWEIWISRSDNGVCEQCAALHGNIYRKGSGPEPGVDTHLGCRCYRRDHHVLTDDRKK